ncbi:hypothetical protein GF366_02435 [Candidatus Peregrinibacteria bacterium]|nr:hypothetical protein [Candidatus Peregrinibacteria bacterium]
MTKLRRVIATLSMAAVLSMLVVSTTASAGQYFDDVPDNTWYASYVNDLGAKGIVDTDQDNYRPGDNLNRAEAVTLLVQAFDLQGATDISFNDVSSGTWYYDTLRTAVANGLVVGYSDGSFRPGFPINRAEFLKIAVISADLPECTMDNPFPDVPAGEWYEPYAVTGYCWSVVDGYEDGTFRGADYINRAEAAKMISMAMDPMPREEEEEPPDIVGDLTFSLSSDNPSGDVIPLSATGVEFLQFDVEGEGVIDSMTFERYGAGETTDFENVYLYEGAERLTTGRSVNSSTHLATFTGFNYVVEGSHTLSLVADLSGTGNGNVDGFVLDTVTSDSSVSGVSSVEGNLFSISAASVGSAEIEKSGILTDPKVGEDNSKVAEFRINAGSSEALEVESITLYQVGSIADEELTNFVLMQGGVEIATADALTSNDYLVFDMMSDPYQMAKGSSRTFEVYADVGPGARDGDTIKFYLENRADLHAIGATYGYGVNVTNPDYDNSANDGTDASWTTVQGGQITISYAGPAVQDYATDSQDVELMRFDIVSQNNVEIRNTRMTLNSGGTCAAESCLVDASGVTNAANFTDVKGYDVETDQVLFGPVDVSTTGSDTTQAFTLTDVWNLTGGEERTIAITADIANYTPVSDETISADLNAFQGNDVKNLENNQYVNTADIVPTGDITGSDHNLATAGLAISTAGTPTGQTYINGSSDLDMVGINLQAGDGKDVYVKAITVTADGSLTDATDDGDSSNDCNTETNCVLTLSLWDGETQVGDTESLSGDQATFNNLNVKVDKGTTKKLVVQVDLNSLSSLEDDDGTPGSDVQLGVDVSANTDVSAQDSEGNAAAVTGTVDGPDHTISDAGILTVALAPDEVDVSESRIIIAGEMETLAKFKFTAQNEELKLSKIRVKVDASDIDDVGALYLYDGETMVSGPVTPNATGYSDFNAWTEDFVIPEDDSNSISVVSELNTISVGADSGEKIIASLDYDDNFEARSNEGTDTVITSVGSADLDGREMTLRKTKMTVEKETVPTSSITNASEMDLYKFSITADDAEDVAIRQLKFEVVITDNVGTDNTLSVDGWKLYRGSTNLTNQVLIQDSSGVSVEGAGNIGEGTETIIVTWANDGLNGEEVISAGATKTYTLRGTPNGFATPSDDDSVSIKLLDDGTAQTAGYNYIDDGAAAGVIVRLSDGTTNEEDANIIWSDNSDVPHLPEVTAGGANPDVSSADWINGYQIDETPLSSNVLIY